MGHSKWKLRVGALAGTSMFVAVGAAVATPTLAGASKPAPAARVQKVNAAELRIARQVLSHVKIGFRPGALIRGSVVGDVSTLKSTNWSGYADKGSAGGFTQVSGSWTQPTVKCGSAESVAAFWVGIDGISSSDPTVEQDGTIVECLGGSALYFDWWEMYPTNDVVLVQEVASGDHIAASVVYSGGSYKLAVTDSSNSSASFSVSEKCGTTACENMSAEWIAEAPGTSTGLANLANFHSWKATSAKETYSGTSGGISGPPTVDKITMIDSTKAVKASTGKINSTNNGFTVTWKKSN